MTPNEINRAIAEFCGWTHVTPDYANDLNAIHEAEKNLSDSGWSEYWFQLLSIIGTHPFDEQIGKDCRDVLHATARQRCEALLRTIGKWTEAQNEKEEG